MPLALSEYQFLRLCLFGSVQGGILALGKAHTRFIPFSQFPQSPSVGLIDDGRFSSSESSSSASFLCPRLSGAVLVGTGVPGVRSGAGAVPDATLTPRLDRL